MSKIKATNILFTNPDGFDDEVQFDTHDENDLAELWWQFCKTEGLIKVNKGIADYVTGEMI